MDNFSLIKLANAIDFLSEDSKLLEDAFESGVLPNSDMLSLINNKIMEINEHWRQFVTDHNLESVVCCENVERFAEDASRRTLNGSDILPKYIMYKKEQFVPIIYKHEWDSNFRAYWAMYAKRTQLGFSSKRVLFVVNGTSLANVLYKFYVRFNECCADKLIRDREWFGSEPFSVDFENDKCNVSVTNVTEV